MQNWKNDIQSCRNPEIVASRLTSMRNIYLREELNTITKKIQEQYKERLPALDLVTIAAYEQVFHRQPLSLPEELRRDAIKYALEYYRLNIEKLRMGEAKNGLCPNHDRLLCSDKNCPLHQFNINLETDENQSNRSSITSDNTLNSTASMDEQSISSSSTSSDTSSDTSSYSTTTDSVSESTSNQSITTRSNKSFSHTETPKIVISRASNDSVPSNSSIVIDNNRTSARKRSKDIHRRSSHKLKSKRK